MIDERHSITLSIKGCTCGRAIAEVEKKPYKLKVYVKDFCIRDPFDRDLCVCEGDEYRHRHYHIGFNANKSGCFGELSTKKPNTDV